MHRNPAMGHEFKDLDVVFVDDTRQDHAIMRSILTSARIGRVRGFASAEEARHAMLMEPPHLVVTDYEMPVVDGLRLVRAMRDPRTRVLNAVPVMLVANQPTRALVERSIALGIHYVLAKPLSPAAVIRRLEAVMHDERGFVLDEASGHYVLEGADRLLGEKRKRWYDIRESIDSLSARTESLAAEGDGLSPSNGDGAREASRRDTSWGLGVPTRRIGAPSVEGATGQPLGRTA